MAVANTPQDILEATRELLQDMIAANGVVADDVAGVIFTTSPDLNAEFPAVAARSFPGWAGVALLCGHEMEVPGSLPRCLRVLMLVNTDKRAEEMVHIYLGEAKRLRAEPTDSAERVNGPDK